MGQCISAFVILVAVVGRCSCDSDFVIANNEHLVSLADVSGTPAITVTTPDGSYSQIHNFPPGTQISPVCSTAARSSRCRRLYIDAIGDDQYIILATLENAVGVMSFRYNGTDLVRKGVSVLSITNTLNIGQCVPLEIIHFHDRPMVLCFNQQQSRQQLISCDIRVNRLDVSQSSLLHCLRLGTFPAAIPYEEVSNFVYFPDVSQVIVIIQQNIYGIQQDRIGLSWYDRLSDPTCDHIADAEDHIFLITCRSGQVFEYNTDTEVLSLLDDVRVLCPSSRFTLTQAGNDTVVRHSSGVEMTITGLNFSSGVCSPAGVLYITDQLGGITVVNATSRSQKRLIDHSHHFEVFDEGYLVVLTTNPSKTILYKSLERVAERSGTGQAVGVILNLTIMRMLTTSPPITPPRTRPTDSSTVPSVIAPMADVSSPKPEHWAVPLMGIAIFIASIVAIIAVIAFLIKRRKSLRPPPNIPPDVELQNVTPKDGSDVDPDPSPFVDVTVAGADSSTGERDAYIVGASNEDATIPLSIQASATVANTECVS